MYIAHFLLAAVCFAHAQHVVNAESCEDWGKWSGLEHMAETTTAETSGTYIIIMYHSLLDL